MLALLLFICWPVAEVLVAIEVANALGVLITILLLCAGWPLGLWALRSQGGAAWRRLSAALAEGRTPGGEVLDGALVVLGGVLLMVPGFITDVIGVGLLLRPTQAVARRILARNLQSRVVQRATGFARPAGAYDVDSTARDVDQSRLHP